MSARCRICVHPRAAAIDEALDRGDTIRELTDAFGLNVGVIYRHRPHRAGREAARAEAIKANKPGTRCNACMHPDAAAIDADLDRGSRGADIVATYGGLSEAGLHRHRQHRTAHNSTDDVVTAVVVAATPADKLERLNALDDALVGRALRDEKIDSNAVAVLRASSQFLAFRAQEERHRQEEERRQQEWMSRLGDPEVIELLNVLRDMINETPSLGLELARRLTDKDAHDAAAAFASITPAVPALAAVPATPGAGYPAR